MLAAVLAVAAASLSLTCRNGVETDIRSLLEPARRSVMSVLADHLGGQTRILLEGPDAESLKKPAAAFHAILDPRGEAADGALLLKRTIDYLAPRSGGLLTDETRVLLSAGKYGEVARASATRLVSGFLTPLFSVKGDPYLLATDYLTHLQSRRGNGWSIADGDPVCEKDGRHFRLLVSDRPRSTDGVLDVLERVRVFNETGGPVRAYASGTPFHTAVAMTSSRREINILSAVSLAAVGLLGFLLFRSLRFLPSLLFTLGGGFLAATAVLFAAVGRPHLLTFVFGTSLIGLGVDYSYHALRAGDVRRILRPLTCSLLTTIACFTPLFFSGVSVLRQMALFTVTGLVAVYALVVTRRGGTEKHEGTGGSSVSSDGLRSSDSDQAEASPARRGRFGLHVLSLFAFAFLAVGISRLRIGNDLASFYRPDPFLAEGEMKFQQLGRTGSGRFCIAEGATVQEALEREEAAGIEGLSAIVPSLRRQRENAVLVSNLCVKTGATYTGLTGIPVRTPAAGQELLDPEKIEDPLLMKLIRPMLVKLPENVLLVSPDAGRDARGQDRDTAVAGISFFDPKQALTALFDGYAAETYRLLCVSFGVLAVLLVGLFRKRVLVYLSPVACAACATLGVLGWCGVTLNFFHVLCFFVFAGLGLDYTIFHRGGGDRGLRTTVLVSFLTSFAGLGLLSFTSFAVTASMGMTLALGLFFSYVFSLYAASVFRGQSAVVSGKTEWYEQREQSAGVLRLRILWWVYCLLGKHVLKLVVAVVMLFIYPFARPARRNLRKFYRVLASSDPASRLPPSVFRLFRHLLGFAWSLADKTDVCTRCRCLPRMTIREDAGSRAFFSLLEEGRGAFLISSHLGTAEVLPALRHSSAPPFPGSSAPPLLHAFQQMGHNAIFTQLFAKHLDTEGMTLHPVEGVGVETAVRMQEAIKRGELVLMAGDRVSAAAPRAVREREFLGQKCVWPKGVFVFAKLMEAPVFFVTCVRTGWNAYDCHFAAAERGADVLDSYVRFLEAETRARPDQWYHFHDFFSSAT